MNIVVIGCGKIGTTIIASLTEEGHNVVAVDKESKRIEELTNIYDVMGVCGSGTDCDMLTEAGVSSAQLVVAVTDSDELNMLCCYIAKKMGAVHTIARIRKPEYNVNNLAFLKEQLDISMVINPELLAAMEMSNILKLPSATKIETFSHRSFEMVELKIKEESAITGVPLSQLRNNLKAKFLVCVVQRGDTTMIPDGSFVLCPGDKIGLTASPQEIQKLMKSLGLERKQARDTILLGGSRIAYYLSILLTSAGNRVKIIERDPEKCEMLSASLPKAVIINGDGAQQEVLAEEGIATTDAFVALTGTDEENILISIFAAANKVPSVIAKVNREELGEMAVRLGLDRIISPKKIVADVIVRYARAIENSLGSNVEALYKIMNGGAEVLEFNVSPDFAGLETPIHSLKLRPGILLGGIIRDKRAVIPAGDDVISSGDRVIVVTAGQRLNDLSDILI